MLPTLNNKEGDTDDGTEDANDSDATVNTNTTTKPPCHQN